MLLTTPTIVVHEASLVASAGARGSSKAIRFPIGDPASKYMRANRSLTTTPLVPGRASSAVN
jgi:hypothetical protein